MGFEFVETSIPDVKLVKPDTFPDNRGFFRESLKSSTFIANDVGPFVQTNICRSVRGAIRGLHFQTPPEETGKLIAVASGRIFDVAVDIRPTSPTFTHWFAQELNAEDGTMMWVPPGLAHGLMALEDDTVVVYQMTGEYAPANDGGIRWDDPIVNVDWPIRPPVLSEKDSKLPYLEEVVGSV
jgi:dTDP-4-dehydrorhamnose 3,5-epimerase